MPMGFLTIIIAAAVRFWLVANLPIQFLPHDIPKDAALLRLAADATIGLEQGSFNQLTFTGLGYPLFLVFTSFSGSALGYARLFSNCRDSSSSTDSISFDQVAMGRGSDFHCARFLPRGTFISSRIAGSDLLGTDAPGIFAIRDNDICAAARPAFCRACGAGWYYFSMDFPYQRSRLLASHRIRPCELWRHLAGSPSQAGIADFHAQCLRGSRQLYCHLPRLLDCTGRGCRCRSA